MEKTSTDTIQNSTSIASSDLSYITSKTNHLIDQYLFNHFTSQQLMEIAGSTVARIIHNKYKNQIKSILVIAGPGNNGGDGIVASRYLKIWGYDVTVFMPKAASDEINKAHVLLAKHFNVPFVEKLEIELNQFFSAFSIIVDAVFGYNFKGDLRTPFDKIIPEFKTLKNIISVDVPSGWIVDDEKECELNDFNPEVLISLCLPKVCVTNYKGEHYLGGRFISPKLISEFNLKYPETWPSENQDFAIINLIKKNN